MRPLSQSGDLRLYLWPLRCLKRRMGGPTFGIEVKGEEIPHFDAAHVGIGTRAAMINSGREVPTKTSPAGVGTMPGPWRTSASTASSSWQTLAIRLAAAALDPAMLEAAVEAVRAHVEQEGDLRPHAIAPRTRWLNVSPPSLAAVPAGRRAPQGCPCGPSRPFAGLQWPPAAPAQAEFGRGYGSQTVPRTRTSGRPLPAAWCSTGDVIVFTPPRGSWR